ncbi:MAG: hypothetical protein AAF682_14140 [Planctomycetota bacterium]
MKAGLAPLLLLGAALGGCQVPEANVYNLREVRDPDGTAKRVGAPMRELEFLLRNALGESFSGDLDLATKEPGAIDDPDTIALDNLCALADADADDPAVLSLQLEMMSWLAVDDGYVLARERAVIELGRLGGRVGLTEPLQLAVDAVPATADDLVGPITDLVRHTRPLLEGGDAPGEPLAQTCEEIEALLLDRDGARRVLAATGALLGRAGFDEPALAPMRTLHISAGRRAAALALGEALLDESELVRAAAIEAGARLSDNGLAGMRLRALSDQSEIVLSSVLRGIGERGIPRPEEALTPAEEWEYRAAWLTRIVAHTRDPRSQVAHAACRTLGKVSGSDLRTLRWEDWTAWWDAEVRARTGAAASDTEASRRP